VLWAALAGMFATTFPITILSVSLTDIAGEFDTNVSTLSWVIAAPMLLSALSVPVLGKLGDLRGHRRVFLIGFGFAVVVSGLTAVAWDPLSLIGLRSLAQVIGSATQPTSMALVMLVFAPHERVKALGWWSFTAAAAPATGLAVGGPLVDLVGWRMIFVVQALLGVSALLLAAFVLPESPTRRVRFDVRGAVTLSLAAGGAVFALGQIGEWGIDHPAVLGSPWSLWRQCCSSGSSAAPSTPCSPSGCSGSETCRSPSSPTSSRGRCTWARSSSRLWRCGTSTG
jgi:MFS family permease